MCPEKPFKLRISSNFSVNTFKYGGSTPYYRHVSSNFIWSEIASKFLTRVKSNLSLDLKDYYNEINKIDIRNEVKELRDNSQIILFSVFGSILMISLILIIYFIIRLKLMRDRNANLNQFRNAVAYETALQLVSVISPPEANPYLGRQSNIHEIE